MQQLIKFCLVGASSTVINQAILAVLLRIAPSLPWWASLTVGFIFGVTNGYYWNRKWTFSGQAHGSARRQFPKFIATNVIGLFLNLLITKGFLFVFTGKALHTTNPNPYTIQLASLCAIPIVVIWNFSASRLWTFKTPRSKSTAMVVPSTVVSPASPDAVQRHLNP